MQLLALGRILASLWLGFGSLPPSRILLLDAAVRP